MEYVAVSAAIIGIVNGIRLLSKKDYWAFVFFAAALVSGIILGYYHWFGLTGVEAGFVAGLVSSGFYRVGEKVGGQ